MAKSEPTSKRKLSTGCAGLDKITGGGLELGRMFLLKGDSGAGKPRWRYSSYCLDCKRA